MKLIIEVKDGSNVAICKKVTPTGMQYLLDLFAKDEMQDPRRLTTDEASASIQGGTWECKFGHMNDVDDDPICFTCGTPAPHER